MFYDEHIFLMNKDAYKRKEMKMKKTFQVCKYRVSVDGEMDMFIDLEASSSYMAIMEASDLLGFPEEQLSVSQLSLASYTVNNED